LQKISDAVWEIEEHQLRNNNITFVLKEKSGTGIGFYRVITRFRFLNICPSMLHTSLIRSTSGRSLETCEQSSALPDLGYRWTETCFHIFFLFEDVSVFLVTPCLFADFYISPYENLQSAGFS